MLPAAASIRKQGANKGATAAFLVATPESGIDSISVTWALLDPFMTIIRPLAALCTAMAAGMSENLFFWEKREREVQLDNSCPVDGCCDGVDCPEEEHRHHHSFMEKLAAGLRFAFGSVWGDIAGWFFIGLFLAAAITVMIPESFMTRFLGGGVSSMLVMLIVGIPLYICATASTPVAAALILKGVSPGAVLVFLLVGPATNITSLSVLFGILGKRSTYLYLIVLAACAMGFGLLTDFFYQQWGISPQAVVGQTTEFLPFWLKLLSSIVVALISLQPLYKGIIAKLGGKRAHSHTSISSFPTFLPERDSHKECDCGQQHNHE